MPATFHNLPWQSNSTYKNFFINVIITAVLQFTKLSDYSVHWLTRLLVTIFYFWIHLAITRPNIALFTRDVIITRMAQLTVNENFN